MSDSMSPLTGLESGLPTLFQGLRRLATRRCPSGAKQ
jgi:hypothetical protein